MFSYWETSQSISSIRTEELPAKRDSVILCNMFSPPFKEQQARRGSLPLQLIPAPVSGFYPGAWRLKVTLEKKKKLQCLINIYMYPNLSVYVTVTPVGMYTVGLL